QPQWFPVSGCALGSLARGSVPHMQPETLSAQLSMLAQQWRAFLHLCLDQPPLLRSLSFAIQNSAILKLVRIGHHKGPPPASSPRSPLRYDESARTARV